MSRGLEECERESPFLEGERLRPSLCVLAWLRLRLLEADRELLLLVGDLLSVARGLIWDGWTSSCFSLALISTGGRGRAIRREGVVRNKKGPRASIQQGARQGGVLEQHGYGARC